jgi:hypothetical protein
MVLINWRERERERIGRGRIIRYVEERGFDECRKRAREEINGRMRE